MSFINKYLRNFTPYQPASHKVWSANGDERQRILKLDWNEATIPPSPKVNERLVKLVNGSPFYNLYPSTFNNELLKMLSDYVGIPQENIQYFSSSDSLHEYIAKLYITVGDPVLLLGPTYDNFRLTAEVCGANVYYHNINEDFIFEQEEFLKEIKRKNPSLVYICNPNNPTGTLHNLGFIQNLLETYPQILFLVDEAYAEFSGISAKQLVLQYENLLISRTMSKAFALANFRFGYLLASKDNIEYISNIRNPKNITTFTQEAVMGALSDIVYMETYVAEVNRASKQFQHDMEQYHKYIKCIHGSGNFVLLQFYDYSIKMCFIQYLEMYNIYVRNLSQTEFLRQYCIRITIGTCPQMKYVSHIISNFFGDDKNGFYCVT